MFFQPALLATLLALPVVFAKVEPGLYTIKNEKSNTTVRAWYTDEPVFVADSTVLPGPYELWDIQDAKDDAQTILAMGLHRFVNTEEKAGAEVWVPIATVMPTMWEITSAGKAPSGEQLYTIQVNDHDLLWNVEPPVKPFGNIAVRGANGAETERFILHCITCKPTVDNKGETETEKYGHLLGQVLSQVGRTKRVVSRIRPVCNVFSKGRRQGLGV